MITVVGEALVDLVITPTGSVEATLGGAPFNTAGACGRLGALVRFVGAVSTDRFGSLLIDRLVADGVDVSGVVRVDAPTTLAAAEIDERGAATYRFYIDGTSAPALDAVPSTSSEVLFSGGLGLVLEPMATTVEQAISTGVHDLVVIDVNCRPLVIADRDDYVSRVDRVLAHADIVKVSDEDLAYLRPESSVSAATAAVLALGPAAVLVTRGGDGVDVVTAAGSVTVPIDPVDVVDTIGAGDSFGAGFLAWWVGNGFGRAGAADVDLLVRAVRAANCVAAVTVGRRGADPPWRHELDADWSS